MKIALLRHGPTEWNVLGRVQGHIDIALSQAGMELMAGLRLPQPFATARAFTSPQIRARQTAAALGLAHPRADARLMEQNWGRWEGLTREEILKRDGPDAFARAGQGLHFRPPAGESTGELHARVAAFLAEVPRIDGDAVAVTHLGVLRAAYTLATGWDMATPMPAELDLSRLLILNLDDGIAIHALNAPFLTRTA